MSEFIDALKSAANRLTNPLLFSLLCAFSIYNWEVVVALLWYDPDEIHRAGYISVYEFISTKLEPFESVGHPLLIAVCYTAVVPFIKIGVDAFQTWVRELGISWNQSIQENALAKRTLMLDSSYLSGTWRLHYRALNKSPNDRKNTGDIKEVEISGDNWRDSLLDSNSAPINKTFQAFTINNIVYLEVKVSDNGAPMSEILRFDLISLSYLNGYSNKNSRVGFEPSWVTMYKNSSATNRRPNGEEVPHTELLPD
jgi:hypothetical protein